MLCGPDMRLRLPFLALLLCLFACFFWLYYGYWAGNTQQIQSSSTLCVCQGCESGEHMPDKKKYVEEMVRVLKPGGTLVIATWCQREETPATPFTQSEKVCGCTAHHCHVYRISEVHPHSPTLRPSCLSSYSPPLIAVLEGSIPAFSYTPAVSLLVLTRVDMGALCCKGEEGRQTVLLLPYSR